jgi:hypothetical protein
MEIPKETINMLDRRDPVILTACGKPGGDRKKTVYLKGA